MKALAAYAPDVAYKTMSEETAHIIVPLETHAASKGFAQAFYDLLDTIRKTSIKEDDLVLAAARAEGFVVAVDADLDVLVTAILQTAEIIFGKGSAFLNFLLGDQTAAQIREPVLDDELLTVKSWVGPLKACTDATLQAHGLTLEQKIIEAELRVLDLEKAEQALDTFRKIGARKELVDSANALRTSTYGALNQLMSSPAGVGLPPDFTDRVFQFERSRRRRRAKSLKEIDKQIASNEKEHAALLVLRAETKAADEAAAKKKALKKVKPITSALDAAKKKVADLQAEIAALEAQVPPPSAP